MEGQIYTGKCIQSNEGNIIKIRNIRVPWDQIEVKTFIISLIMRYQIAIANDIYVQQNCGLIYLKNRAIERTKQYSEDPELF